MQVTFIGGPLDGQKTDEREPPSPNYYCYARPEYPAAMFPKGYTRPTTLQVSYRLEQLRANHDSIFFYVESSLSLDQAMQKLFRCYKPR